MLIVLFYDNTWYLLNVYVQSIGYYLQNIVQLGFHTGKYTTYLTSKLNKLNVIQYSTSYYFYLIYTLVFHL